MAETPIPSRSVSPWWCSPEVTVENTFALGNRQLIVRAGKVIHSDKLIAGFGQRGDGLLQNVQLLLGGRQIRIFDFALSGEQRRQVRIVKDAQTVRVKLSHAFKRVGEALRRLLRQAVNQVYIR